MPRLNPLPDIWLLSDARNDAHLPRALEDLPERSGFVFRHYHLPHDERLARFAQLMPICRSCNHLLVLAGDGPGAAAWGADGFYGPPARLNPRGDLLRLATVHNAQEIDQADSQNVDGMFLSPVFATSSHPGGATLGIDGFHVLAGRTSRPVIALGGMNRARAGELGWPRWGGIDAFLR